MKTSPDSVDINNNETTAQIKLQTEKQISNSSQIDRNMTRLTAATDYEPYAIRLFHNQGKTVAIRSHSPQPERNKKSNSLRDYPIIPKKKTLSNMTFQSHPSHISTRVS